MAISKHHKPVGKREDKRLNADGIGSKDFRKKLLEWEKKQGIFYAQKPPPRKK
jgi:hypothetical protein